MSKEQLSLPSDDEIWKGVSEEMQDALGLDDHGELVPEAKLRSDLGAESISDLDMVYKLEKRFGVEINRSDWYPAEYSDLFDGLSGSDKLTEDHVQALRDHFDEVSPGFVPNVKVGDEVRDTENLLNLDFIQKYITHKLRSKLDGTES